MSLWKKISLGVVIVILLLLGSVAFLVGTTSGLHLVFKAADRWVPGLDIGKVTGGWRDLTLSDVRYEQPGVAVKAGNLHLAVGLECLWNSSVCINDLALKDIQVNIDSKKMPPSEQVEEEEDSGPLDLSTPYPITLTRVALDNVNIKIDDTTVSVMDFTSGLNWQEKTLTLKPTSLPMAQQRQDRRGEVQAATASATGLACFIFRFLRRPLDGYSESSYSATPRFPRGYFRYARKAP